MNRIGRLLIVGLLTWVCMAAVPALAAAAAHIQAEFAIPRLGGAQLEAEIDPLGEATTCHAQYVSDAQFQASGYAGAVTLPCDPPELAAGTGTRTATVSLAGLGFHAAYHYRFLANAEEGADQTFTTYGAEDFDFGIENFAFDAVTRSGEPAAKAGSHPDSFTTIVTLKATQVTRSLPRPTGITKDILTELPPGMAGSAVSVPQCPTRLAEAQRCPGASQVGTVTIATGGNKENGPSPLYSVTPPKGVAARFAAVVNLSTAAFIDASIRTGDDYGVTAGSHNITQLANMYSVTVKMWGVPESPLHDPERTCPTGVLSSTEFGCSSTAPEKPLLTMPTSCGGPLTVRARADAYSRPDQYSLSTQELPAITGCNSLRFEPTIEARPTTNVADSPTGLSVDLHVPQPQDPEPSSAPTLGCDTGTWSGAPNQFTFRWLRNGAVIPGAEGSTYTQTPADAGSVLQCEVEADNGVGPGLAASPVFLARPIPSPAPPVQKPGTSIPLSGSTDPTSGDTILTCDSGTWLNSGGGSAHLRYAFRWFKDGAFFAEDKESPAEEQEVEEGKKFATDESTVTVPAGETPFSMQCEVLVTRLGFAAVAFSEAFTSEPAPEPPLPSPIRRPTLSLPGAGPGLATANLRDAVVQLPPGLTVNPSSAAGLEGCTPEQFGLTTPVGTSPIHTTSDPAQCPDRAKIGSVEVDTPLLDHPLPGAVYLAQPYQNPFGSLLAIYIAVYDPISGVVVKLAGHVELGPEGQLTTTFDENPQLPFEDFKLDFFNGPRAALKTPGICGELRSTSTLTPWSAPETGPPATPHDSYAISRAPGGGSCPTSQGARPNLPSFQAGTETPLAGAYSPFVLNLRRDDGSQTFRSLTVTPPAGLLGRLAGIPYCPDSALAAAAGKSGAEERAAGSCPGASEVGSVDVAAGAGPAPFHVGGRAYLAGPYKGAPLSLAIITPAVAGPYDLGTVVVRSALAVNPETTQITVTSDPIPTELKGIPLDIRSISVRMDRPSFTLNPTNCEAKDVGGTLTSSTGSTVSLRNRFQVGECRRLKFRPKLKLRLKGSTRRIGHPALKAVVTYPKKGVFANIAAAQVNLPHSEFLDQGNLNKTCTRPVLAAGNCPPSTVYGRAKVWTPLLDRPLQGKVYLVGGYGYKLPALVAELNGQIRVLLVGKIDSGKNKGIRNSFQMVPDAPVSRFVLEMKGGRKYGLLENSENLCRKTQRLGVRFVAQNGLVEKRHPRIANSCKRKHKRHRKGHDNAGRRHAKGKKKGSGGGNRHRRT